MIFFLEGALVSWELTLSIFQEWIFFAYWDVICILSLTVFRAYGVSNCLPI